MEDETIDLGRCFKAVLQKWWLILIVAIGCFGVAFALTSDMPRNYTATVKAYSAISTGTSQSATVNTVIMQAYSDIISSGKVADRAAVLLGNDDITGKDIEKMIDVDFSSSSIVFTISATDKNQKVAMAVANAVADSFAIEAKTITGTDTVQILDKATTAKEDKFSKHMKFSILAFLVGFFIPAFLICVKECLSDEVHVVEDASLSGQLEILGVIPEQNQR